MNTQSRLLLTILLTVAFAANAAANDKVGFVDLNLIMGKLEDGRKAKRHFERAVKSRKVTFEKKKKELKLLKEELEKKQNTLKRDAMNKKLEVLQQKVMEIQKYYQDSQQSLMKLQGKVYGPIFKRLSTLVSLVAEKNGLTLMLERQKSGLLYADDSLNYSEQVIKAYNGLKGD